ncbi:MAG: HEAT repeat domain-containing protein [Chloroflexota bacterium]
MADIEQLAAQLRDGDEETRKQAAIALGQSGSLEAVPPLLAALNDPLRSVRKAAYEVLIATRDPRTIEPAIEAAAEGRLDFNAVAYSLERKFDVADAYPRTWAALQTHGDAEIIAKARPAYERWQKRQ